MCAVDIFVLIKYYNMQVVIRLTFFFIHSLSLARSEATDFVPMHTVRTHRTIFLNRIALHQAWSVTLRKLKVPINKAWMDITSTHRWDGKVWLAVCVWQSAVAVATIVKEDGEKRLNGWNELQQKLRNNRHVVLLNIYLRVSRYKNMTTEAHRRTL